MAASALAAAAAEYGSDEEEPDEDDGRCDQSPDLSIHLSFSLLSDDGLRHSATDTSSPPVKLGGKKKAIPSTVSLSIGSMRGLGSSAERPTFALSQEDMDGTIDVLVSILQDPDHGVPRALDAALKDLRVKRGLPSRPFSCIYHTQCTHTSTHHTQCTHTSTHHTQCTHTSIHHTQCTHTSTHHTQCTHTSIHHT